MYIDSLFEARRNPDVNTANRQKDVLKNISRYFLPYHFLTLTDLPKVGINPRTDFTTPMGIYTYPLDEPLIQMQIQQNSLPYGGDAPYMNIGRAAVSSRILSLDDITEEQFRDADYPGLVFPRREIRVTPSDFRQIYTARLANGDETKDNEFFIPLEALQVASQDRFTNYAECRAEILAAWVASKLPMNTRQMEKLHSQIYHLATEKQFNGIVEIAKRYYPS